jgi:ribosome modulation factor
VLSEIAFVLCQYGRSKSDRLKIALWLGHRTDVSGRPHVRCPFTTGYIAHGTHGTRDRMDPIADLDIVERKKSPQPLAQSPYRFALCNDT